MSRSLRIEYPGAFYHVFSRANNKKRIFFNQNDYQLFINVLEKTVIRYNWICYSYCLMPTHYHLLIETPAGNLSLGMRYLNGVFTQKYNKANNQTGHIFQGRYKSILVQKDLYFMRLVRYIHQNPLKAGLIDDISKWEWSSYLSITGKGPQFNWLNTAGLLGHFGPNITKARKAFNAFLGEEPEPLLDETKSRIFLGDDKFVKKFSQNYITSEIPAYQQRLKQKPLRIILRNKADMEIYSAHVEHGYKIREIAAYLKLHYSTVSKRIKNYEKYISRN